MKTKNKKLRIYSTTAVGHDNKVKDSFEPDSNQRSKDINYASTVLRSTTWAIEGTLTTTSVLKGDMTLHETHELGGDLLN